LRTEAVEREEAVKFNKSLNEKQVKAEYLKEKAEAGAITQYRAGLSMHGFSQRLLTTEKPVNFVVK
jgi:alkylated DNA repair dioxygenase AlkB